MSKSVPSRARSSAVESVTVATSKHSVEQFRLHLLERIPDAARVKLRGVSSVEYALLLVTLLIVGALAWHMLGREVRAKVECAAGWGENCAKGGAVASNGSAGGDGSGGWSHWECW